MPPGGVGGMMERYWGGIGMLQALGFATIPLVQRPFIYFKF